MTKLLRLIKGHSRVLDGSVVTIGNFDGIHRGHRLILDCAFAEALSRSLPCAVVTFEPHPGKVLAPEERLELICPYHERYRLLAALGADMVAVQEFTPEFARTEPEEWVKDVLVNALQARHVVIGYDFRFGHDARGTAEALTAMGAHFGFSVEQVRAATAHGLPISSSRIRRLVAAGEMTMVTDLLGYPFSIRGVVVEGKHRGSSLLGFPTANLKTDWELIPSHGVYAGIAVLSGTRYVAGINVGVNPTFDETRLSIEAHLQGIEEELYGREIELHFIRRLRDEKKFDNVDELIRQVGKDMTRARHVVMKRIGIELR